MAEDKKKMKLLSELEHVLKRPEMYVSSTVETDETVHYIEQETIESDEDSKTVDVLHTRTMSINVGMYKLLWEIFDNSVDEIKRVKAKSKAKAKRKHVVEVVLDQQNNKISVRDNGEGFYKAVEKNTKSKVTNIETAFCFLRAGSNFENDDIAESLIGTNGVGATLCNMLSDHFYVLSVNNNSRFEQNWFKFEAPKKASITKKKYTACGTKVEFIPRKEVFGNSKYDVNIIRSQLAFRKKCMLMSPEMENIQIVFRVVDEEGIKNLVSLPTDFFHPDSYVVETDNFMMAITTNYEKSNDFLMVNSTQCTGSPIRYIQEQLNENVFKQDKANTYYNIQLFLNLPPNLVKFGDQNKTKYSIPKNKIAPFIQEAFKHRNIKLLHRFPKSDTYKEIVEAMSRLGDDKEQKAILKDKNKVSKMSKKYLPASGKKDFLFIVEGESAAGSISQGRNPSTQAIYQLQGKIQNCRKIADLRTNKEIMEMISILDLKFDSPATAYQNIVIATDFDPDGIGHIASLLINFFYKWFPQVVTHNKLFILKVPLARFGTGKAAKFVYSLEEMNKVMGTGKKPVYLKGLGSINREYWSPILDDMRLMRIRATKESEKILEMAFGSDSDLRKKWLDEVSTK